MLKLKNVLGGKEIKFDGESQYGKISVKMATGTSSVICGESAKNF